MQMLKRGSLIVCMLALVIGAFFAGTLSAQQSLPSTGVEQEFLLNAPVNYLQGKRVDVFVGKFKPGARTPMHRHPGIELLYVLEGNGEMLIPGQENRPLSPGKIVLVEPAKGEDSFVHLAVNRSATEGMKTLVIVIHDEGTPLATPVADDTKK